MDVYDLLADWQGGDRQQRAMAVIGEQLFPLLSATGLEGDKLVVMTAELATKTVRELSVRGLLG